MENRSSFLFLFLLLLISFLLLWFFFFSFFFRLWLFWLLLSISTCILVLVHSLSDFHGRVLESFKSFSDFISIFCRNCFVQSSDVTVYLIFHILRNLFCMFCQLLFRIVDCLIGFVLHINGLSSLLVLFFACLSVLDHLFDISVTKTTA